LLSLSCPAEQFAFHRQFSGLAEHLQPEVSSREGHAERLGRGGTAGANTWGAYRKVKN